MIYRFIIHGYNDVGYFDIPVKTKLDMDNHMFIRFRSDKSSKIVSRFYKDVICQGGKPSSCPIIDELGFFDAGYQHWTEFESFNKSIIYEYFMRDFGIIELYPNHIAYTHDRNESEIIDL